MINQLRATFLVSNGDNKVEEPSIPFTDFFD